MGTTMYDSGGVMPTSPSRDEADAAPVSPPGAEVPCPLVITLEIIIRPSGRVISHTRQTKIVGQKIQLGVRTQPRGHTMSNIQWTIPGETVKSYTQSSQAGVRRDLSEADFHAEDVDLYWIAAGRQHVEVVATVRGRRLRAAVNFHILAPTDVSMTSHTGAVAVSDPGFGDGDLELHYGISGTPGIAWILTATAPAGGDGEIAGTQLVES